MDEPLSTTGFSDVSMVYNALPELDWDAINTDVYFLGKKLAAPLLINAMTGGHCELKFINRALARVAARFGLAMAIGSQTVALEDPGVRDSFAVVRRENPDGILLANLNARASWVDVKKAVEMISADGIQLHLNAAHELAMPEGERTFKEILANIENLVKKSEVPVIVKEVGFGISREVAYRLHQAGVKYIDVAGRGGTDFVEIENCRAGRAPGVMRLPGISTVVSLIECLSLNLPINIIASGGITNGLEIASALSLGAGLVGIAGHFLRILLKDEEGALDKRVKQITGELRQVMLLCGAVDIDALRRIPVVIRGTSGEWLMRRGIDLNYYAQR